MKWSTKKTPAQENKDIAEAAIVSAGCLVFSIYGALIDNPVVIIVTWLVTGVIVYSSYKISNYRKRVEKYREGIFKIYELYGGNNENT